MKRPYFGLGPAPLPSDIAVVDRLDALRFRILKSPPRPPGFEPQPVDDIEKKRPARIPPLRAGFSSPGAAWAAEPIA